MRKRISRLLVVTMLLSMILALPVFGQEVTEPTQVIREETFNAGEEALQKEFHNSEVWRAGYYVEYLDGVIYNLNETVRIKQEVVTNYKYLSQYNPYYSTLIPAAEQDVIKAQAWVEYYKQYRAAVAEDFAVRYR